MSKGNALPGFGINVEIAPPDAKTRIRFIMALSKLRVEWVRLRINVNDEARIGAIKAFIQECNRHGIQVLGTLANDVPGTLKNVLFSRFWHTPVYIREKEFFAFVKSIVTALTPVVSHWEILNEIDTYRYSVTRPNATQYVNLLTATRGIIRSINRNSRIVFAGLLGDGTRKIAPGHAHQFLEASLVKGASEHFDILNFHPYTLHSFVSRRHKKAYLDEFQKSITQISAWSQRLLKPVWITEFGISPRWVHLTQIEIAEVYWLAYTLAKEKNIPVFFWHLIETRKHLYEPGSPEKHFGLLNEDLTPKPLFTELANLIQRQ